MSPATEDAHRLRTAIVLRVTEDACDVWIDDNLLVARFAAMFPTPRVDRVLPGHLVALATSPDGDAIVVWRWYDAVVLGSQDDGSVRLWEPAHGEVVAQARDTHVRQAPGTRAWASAGLPGAEWWVAGSTTDVRDSRVELDAVDALYVEYGLWPSVFVTES